MKIKNTVKIEWLGGRNATGYITDFRPARINAKYPDVGSALFVATGVRGQIDWSERRPFSQRRAKESGLI